MTHHRSIRNLKTNGLNNIYNFESNTKTPSGFKLYDFLGRPSFKKIEELMQEGIGLALAEIQTKMEEKGVELDCCANTPFVIYKFITEELFDHEMDRHHVPGLFIIHLEEFQLIMKYDYEARQRVCTTSLFAGRLMNSNVHKFTIGLDPEVSEHKPEEIIKVIR